MRDRSFERILTFILGILVITLAASACSQTSRLAQQETGIEDSQPAGVKSEQPDGTENVTETVTQPESGNKAATHSEGVGTKLSDADINGSDNIRSSFTQVVNSLQGESGGEGRVFSPEELKQFFDSLETIRAEKWRGIVEPDEFSSAYLNLVSHYLKRLDAAEYKPLIKLCMDSAEKITGGSQNNPFMLFVKGLLKQSEGNMEEALGYVCQAAHIAQNNRDLSYWLKAYNPDMNTGNGEYKAISISELNLDSDSIYAWSGTLWLDEIRILATAFEKAGTAEVQRLLAINTDSMECDEIYRGKCIQFEFLTPDRKFVVLHDEGLKLIELETKKIVEISNQGLSCSLSPDGKTIAYSEKGIWIYDIASGSKRKIDDGRDDACPIWFPDGSNLLFIGDLGGEELGSGAGHIQGIFKIPVDNPGGKRRIAPDLESKFHYVRWIIPGEVLHIERGWDDGFESVVMNIFSEDRKMLCSAERGETLYYGSDGMNLFVADNHGMVTRYDERGRTMSLYKFGDIWGDLFGVDIRQITILPGGEKVVFSYVNYLTNKTTLWIADMNMENALYLGEIPDASAPRFVLNPEGNRMIIPLKNDRLGIINFNRE